EGCSMRSPVFRQKQGICGSKGTDGHAWRAREQSRSLFIRTIPSAPESHRVCWTLAGRPSARGLGALRAITAGGEFRPALRTLATEWLAGVLPQLAGSRMPARPTEDCPAMRQRAPRQVTRDPTGPFPTKGKTSLINELGALAQGLLQRPQIQRLRQWRCRVDRQRRRDRCGPLAACAPATAFFFGSTPRPPRLAVCGGGCRCCSTAPPSPLPPRPARRRPAKPPWSSSA